MTFPIYTYQGKKNELSIQFSPEDALAIGTGSSIWDSALVLAKYLERHSATTLVNKKVLELGCGTGLVGMVILFNPGCFTICFKRKVD